jgi:hypothetical protein
VTVTCKLYLTTCNFLPRCLETRMPMASSETAARTTSRGRLQARTPLRSAPAWIAHALASVRMRALKNLLPIEDVHGCVGACSRRARVRARVNLSSPDENGSRASGSLRLIDERCEGPDGSPLRVFACLLGGFFFGSRVCLFRAVRLRLFVCFFFRCGPFRPSAISSVAALCCAHSFGCQLRAGAARVIDRMRSSARRCSAHADVAGARQVAV